MGLSTLREVDFSKLRECEMFKFDIHWARILMVKSQLGPSFILVLFRKLPIAWE